MEKFKLYLQQIYMRSGIVLLCVVLITVLLWFFVARKKEKSYFKWTGLVKPKIKTSTKVLLGFILEYLIYTRIFLIFFMKYSELYIRNEYNLKWLGLIPVALESIVIIGFSVELLFRGWLAKAFISQCGNQIGNILQTIIYGLTQVGLLYYNGLARGLEIRIIIIFALLHMVNGYLVCKLNERVFGGSIIPSIFLGTLTHMLNAVIIFGNLI